MLYINKTRSELGRVNLQELAEVRKNHMPTQQVRFASPGELARVANETARQHPHLREEATYVHYEELGRRQLLADTSMRVLEGGQYRG